MLFAIMNWHGLQENVRLDHNGQIARCTR
jgi:hypothetical protein